MITRAWSRRPSTWRIAGAAAGSTRCCSPTGPPKSGPGRPGRSAGRSRPTRTAVPAAAGRGLPRGARAHADRRAARPAGPAAGVVPAQPRPAARRTRAADRVPRGAGGGCLRRPAAALPAGPGLLDLVPGRSARASWTRGWAARSRRGCRTCRSSRRPTRRRTRIRPRDAVLLAGGPPGLAEFLAPVLPGLIDGPAGIRRWRCSGCAGCRWPSLPTCSPPWAGIPPGGGGCTRRWPAPGPQELGELGALPVPLADGRLVRGPRGLLLPGPGLAHPDQLAVLGLRVVHPEAAHPLLARLGAAEARRAACLRTRPPAPPSPRPTTGRPRPTTTTTVPRGWPTRCSAWSPRCAPSLATTPGSPTSRCRATTASGTRRANCCCPAHRWRRWSRRTRRSASSTGGFDRTATQPWRRPACCRPSGCCRRRTSRSMSPRPTWTWTAREWAADTGRAAGRRAAAGGGRGHRRARP